MAVYVVTGRLGGGKTLMSLHRIEEYLRLGRPVATNLDIRPWHMLPRSNRSARLIRLPDQPTLDDFIAIGKGNTTYDEDKNGLIVLDECGIWFNSRSWGDKTRQPMIDWLLYSRKDGWDVIFIVQDVGLIDKQARIALGEHVVYCRRTDRMNLPLIGPLFKLMWGGKLPLPRIHIGVVKYGLLPNSLTVDTWTCLGNRLFMAYDTKQRFTHNYPHGVHSLLPPGYTHSHWISKKNLRFFMRLTKIYARKYSRFFMFALGGTVMFFMMLYTSGDRTVNATVSSSIKNEVSTKAGNISEPSPRGSAPEEQQEPVLFPLDFVQAGKRFYISFNGNTYSQFDFPYKLTFEKNRLYAALPAAIAEEQVNNRKLRKASLTARREVSEVPQP